nr:transposase [Listeria sp. SHR_NRA_18]
MEESAIAMLSLQRIQNDMIYMNTLKIQSALRKKEWQNKMETEDYRALTSMIYNHINPYGEFHMNMEKRIHL